jgi:uncharacterized protein YpmB
MFWKNTWLPSLILKMEAVHSSERAINISRLHGITSQKATLFIVTTIRTSDLTGVLLARLSVLLIWHVFVYDKLGTVSGTQKILLRFG